MLKSSEILNWHLEGGSIPAMGQGSSEVLDMALLDRDDLQQSMLHYQHMIMLFDSAVKCIAMRLDLMEKECAAKGWHVPIHSVTSRIKNPMSINKKLQGIGAPLTINSIWEHLYDVAGVRVVCEYLSDIYTIREMLLSENHLELIREKDYIKNPKANGYRSLHLVVNVPVPLAAGTQKIKCEIQLRTTAMDSWASLEHHLRYKNDTPRHADTDRELKLCADMLYETDQRMQRIAEKMRVID